MRSTEEPGRAAFENFYARRYHQPSDEFHAIESFGGAAEDAELLYLFGYALATSEAWPEWREDSPYRRPAESASSNR